MRSLLAVPFAALLLASAVRAETPPPAKEPVEMKPSGTPGQATAKRTARLTATVKALDAATRSITLEAKGGETQTFKVDPEVKRFDEIAVGDVLAVEFTQGLALEFQPAGAEDTPPTAIAAGGKAGKDAAPGAAVAAGIQSTVTVTKIDSKKRLVSFTGPAGNTYTVKADAKIHLEKLKVGDKLLATYVEAVAVKLEKKAAKPAKAEKKEAAPKK